MRRLAALPLVALAFGCLPAPRRASAPAPVPAPMAPSMAAPLPAPRAEVTRVEVLSPRDVECLRAVAFAMHGGRSTPASERACPMLTPVARGPSLGLVGRGRADVLECEGTLAVYEGEWGRGYVTCSAEGASGEALAAAAGEPSVTVDGPRVVFARAVDTRALVARAKAAAGPAKVAVPARWIVPYTRLVDPKEHLVFGESCGAAGRSPPGYDAIDALVAGGRLDLVSAVLRGPNDTARLYAARILLARPEVSVADGHAIAALALEGKSVLRCSGCTMFDAWLAGELR